MKLRLLRVLCLLLLSQLGLAQAMLIDFEGKSGFTSTNGGSFDIDGYRFALTNVNQGFLIVTNQAGLIETGTTKLFAANHSLLTITRVDGGLFDLLSLDIGGSWEDPGAWDRWADSVTLASSAGSTMATLLGQPATFQSISPDFLGISSVVFRPAGSGGINDFEFNIDNINLQSSTVPEPSTLAILLSAALAAAAVRRRSRG